MTQANPTDMVLVRAATDEDRGFIFSSWKESFGQSAWSTKFPTKREYYAVMNCVLDHIKPSCWFRVACLRDEPNVAIGWVSLQLEEGLPKAIYVYVKPKFRKMGLFKTLMGAEPASSRSFDVVTAIERAKQHQGPS